MLAKFSRRGATSRFSRNGDRTLFPRRGSKAESKRIGELLRKETVGGLLLVAAALVAILWANSPIADSYFALRDFEIGYEPWHLKLSLGAWAADGLLAIFFFLVGLELKREFVAGDLRSPRTAIVPVAAAAGGVLVPALIYTAIVRGDADLAHGWAIPTATDIAFALGILGAPTGFDVRGRTAFTGVDAHVVIIGEHGEHGGAFSRLATSLDARPTNRATILGEAGRIEVPPMFHETSEFDLVINEERMRWVDPTEVRGPDALAFQAVAAAADIAAGRTESALHPRSRSRDRKSVV